MSCQTTFLLRSTDDCFQLGTIRERQNVEPCDPDCTSIVTVMTEVGISNFFLGEHELAMECYSQALRTIDCKDCKQIQSEIRHDMDASICKQNSHPCQEYDEGMRIYNQPIHITKSSSKESLHSLLFYNIAQTYTSLGQYHVARKWFERSFARNQTSVDYVSKVLHNLGYCSYRLGQHEKSMEYYHQALSLNLELGMGRSDLAASLNCLGVLQFRNEEPDKTRLALDFLQQSLEIYRSTTDVKTSTAVATVLNNIGRVKFRCAEYEASVPFYDQALQVRRQVLGNNSIDVAATMYNKGQALQKVGRLDQAMTCYEKFVCIVRSHNKSDTADIALAYRSVAEIHRDKGDQKQAFRFLVRALQAQRTCLGNVHQQIAPTLNMLGNLCYEMNRYQEALKYYRDGLEVEEAVLDSGHPHILITWTNIAHIEKIMGQHAAALSDYRNVYLMQVELAEGDESLEIAETLANMGLMHYHLREYEEALYCYEDSLRIRRQHFGSDDHPEIASSLNSMGLVLFKQGVFDLAKLCFTESLRIRRTVLGPDHRDVAILYYNIATIYFEMGEEDEAVQLYKETLRIERVSLGNDHPDVVLTLQHLGQVFQQLGQFDDALVCLLEAVETEQRTKGSTCVSAGKIWNQLGNVFLHQGRTNEMMDSFARSLRIFEQNQLPQSTLSIVGFNLYGMSKAHPPCAPTA